MQKALFLIPLALVVACKTSTSTINSTAGSSGSGSSAAITAEDLQTRLYTYADDSMMGREAWTAGNYKATAYIAAQLERIGLEPAGEHGTYFQEVPSSLDRMGGPKASIPARNVIAVLRGSDPILRNQYVAIGAHNDHIGLRRAGPLDHDSLHTVMLTVERLTTLLGRRLTGQERMAIKVNLDSLRQLRPARPDSVYNGADDDGTGTVSVLEIAQAFAAAGVKPKRSILFVWHTGEEKGLLGSMHFTDHPTVPLDSIVAQLNIDMIGRGDPDQLFLVGSRRLSTQLGDLIEAVNNKESNPLKLDYTLDANGHVENLYCRSDHYMYARYGIPVTFFFTGLHIDYHQLTDEPQYIDYKKLARVANLVYDVAQQLANAPNRPLVDKPKPDPKGSCRQ